MPWNKQKLISSPMRALLDECVLRGLRAEYHQSFLGLTIAVIVVDVPSNDIAVLRPLMPAVLKALPNSKPGTVTHVHG